MEIQGSAYMAGSVFALPDSFPHPWLLGGGCSFLRGTRKGHTPVFPLFQMSRTKGDEEEYWNSSKFKAFTFDDEDDELSQVGFWRSCPLPQLHSKTPARCVLGNPAFGHVSIRLRNVWGQIFTKMFMEKSPQKRARRTVKTNSALLYIIQMIHFFLFPPQRTPNLFIM